MVVRAEDMISELLYNIQEDDFLKAHLVLSHLSEIDEQSQKKLIYALSRAEIDFKVPLLLFLIEKEIDESQKSFIKEMVFDSLSAYPEYLPDLIVSDRVANIRELVTVAKKVKVKHIDKALITRLGQGKSNDEMVVILDYLGSLRLERSVPVIEEFLYADSRDLVTAAIRALGKTRLASAVTALAGRMHTDNDLDSIILMQFAEIQDEGSIQQLCLAMASSDAFLRTYAKKELAAIGSTAVSYIAEALTGKDDDLIIHSLNVLGDIAESGAINPIRHLLNSLPQNANVRFAAYEALSFLPVAKTMAVYNLTAGLSDSDHQVCLAAARAIEQNYSETLTDGMRNLLKGPRHEVKKIVRSIIDAEADKIFTELCSEEIFVQYATDYLRSAHSDLRKRYSELFITLGKTDAAREILGQEQVTTRQKVVAVDDSRMILSIYKSSLHELGYEPVLFEFPASALKWLEKEQPLAILTDLNMPEITGIELAERIRETYSSNHVPIMMVTTQNEQRDNQEAEKAGVNMILHKPFTTKSLGDAMSKLLGESD